MDSPDQLFQHFVELIHQRTGILIQPHQHHALHDALENLKRRFGITDPSELLCRLQQCTSTDPLYHALIDGITVDESYFYREPGQIDHLANKLLPELIRQRRQEQRKSLRIWSAGCSQGQGPNPLAIILYRLLPDFDHWNLNSCGSQNWMFHNIKDSLLPFYIHPYDAVCETYHCSQVFWLATPLVHAGQDGVALSDKLGESKSYEPDNF